MLDFTGFFTDFSLLEICAYFWDKMWTNTPLRRMATPFCQRARKNTKKRDFCNFQGFPQNPVENEYFVNKLNFFQNLYKGRDSFLSGAYFLHSFKKPIKSSICIGFYALFYTVFNIVFCAVEKLWIIRELFHSS